MDIKPGLTVREYDLASNIEYDRSIKFSIAACRYGRARGKKNQRLAVQYRQESNACFGRYTLALLFRVEARMRERE